MKASPSDHTVANYVEYLEDAFLFSEAKRWDVKGRRYLDYPLKYYSEGPGLRNARLGFRDVEPSSFGFRPSTAPKYSMRAVIADALSPVAYGGCPDGTNSP